MSTQTNKSGRILIVDDNPRNIEVVANLLSGHHYEIEFASSGEEALQWVENTSFDLILMDIMMPGINGYEACRMIKEKNSCKDIPVIFLTAKTDTGSLAKAFEVGGVDYVSKPFRVEELLARVATHLELREKRKALLKVNELLEEKVRQRTHELKKANEQLSIALKDLQKLDATKNDFLHMVSHELRTPLNGILGGVELLKMHDFPDDIKEYLNMLDISTQRLEKFAYQALDISQLQTRGKQLLKTEVISLPSFLTGFIQQYQIKNRLTPEKLLFHSFIQKVETQADPQYLQKVLEILLDNAFEYAEKQFPVSVFLKEEKGKPVCIIQDKGRGFPKNMLKESMLSFLPGIEHEDQKTGLNLHYAQLIMYHFDSQLLLKNAREGGAVAKLIFQACHPGQKN